MAINIKINDRTHKTIIFKKRKVIDFFNRNLIINSNLIDFKWNLMGFVCSSDDRFVVTCTYSYALCCLQNMISSTLPVNPT